MNPIKRLRNENARGISPDFDTDKYLEKARRELVGTRTESEKAKIFNLNDLVYNREDKEKPKPFNLRLLIALALLIPILAVLLIITKPYITGLVTFGEATFSDTINIEFNSSSEYTWKASNLGDINSLRVSGQLRDNAVARIYIENEGIRYLILNTARLNTTQGISQITGFALKENEKESDKDYNDTDSNKNKDDKDIKDWSEDKSDAIAENETQELNQTINTTQPLNDTIDTIINETINLTPQNERALEQIEIALKQNEMALEQNEQALEQIKIALKQSEQNELILKQNELILKQNELILKQNELILKQNELILNKTRNETAEITKPINKPISIKLEYNYGTAYDEDNDGTAAISDAIDFTVENTLFAWNADESNLCARWEVYSIETDKATTACYGSNECCALIELSPSRDSWKEPLYLTYNLLGATYSNIVSAQVIYANYSAQSADIEFSSFANLSAKFKEDLEGLSSFENICEETCLLSGFNKTSYKLIIEVDSGKIILEDINYAVENPLKNTPPILISDMGNYSLRKGSNLTINLSEHFYDADNDMLSYTSYKDENLDISVQNNIAVLVPDKNFTGTIYTFFTANDSEYTAVSNVFAVNVSKEEELLQLHAEINKPVHWIKKVFNDDLEEKTPILHGAFNISVERIEGNQKTKLSKDKITIHERGHIKSLNNYELNKSIERLTMKLGEDINASASNETEVIISDSAAEFEITFFTDPPEVIEQQANEHTKLITISSALHYTNVLAYTSIPDAPQSAIKLYWVKNNTRELFENVTYNDTNGNGLIDYIEWIVPHLSNQTFEVSITVLNVQSYPTVGGNWTVRFNTTGTGNLTISAINSTTYSEYYDDDSLTTDDLDILELKCEDEVLFSKYDLTNSNNIRLIGQDNQKYAILETINQAIPIKSLYAENYNCDNRTGYWTVKVLTPGVHDQRFNFSEQIADAHNLAFVDDTDTQWSSGTFDRCGISGTGSEANVSCLNISGHFASKIFDSNNDIADWENISIVAEAYYGIEIGEGINDSTTAPTTPLPHVPSINTSGLVLLMHFNNESALGENATGNSADRVYDFSVDVNSERAGSIHNNGTTKNGATINKTSFVFGEGAGQFDGSNDYINIDINGLLPNMALVAWIYPTAGGVVFTEQGASSLNGLWHVSQMEVSSTGEIEVGYWTDSLFSISLGTFSLNQWHHVVFIFDNSDNTAKGYVDGVYRNSGTGDKSNPSTGDLWYAIGATDSTNHGDGTYFNGRIDEIAIWNRTLSADEIKNIYLRGAYNLNLSVRTCDDSACAGETWTQIINGSGANVLNGSKMPMDLAKRRYFQYNITYSNFSAANSSANFTPKLNINNVSIEFLNDTMPVVNTTFNTTSPRNIDVINFTGNVTDDTGLLSANWTINFTTGTVFMNYTLSGTSTQVSNTTNLYGIAGGSVLNFTLYVTDTYNNVKQNSTLLTVTDALVPVVNTTFNITLSDTAPKSSDVINFSGNITDETGLLFANITYNISGSITYVNFTGLSGTSAQVSNVTTLTGGAGTIINFTMYITDTSNNVRQNSTLVTIRSTLLPSSFCDGGDLLTTCWINRTHYINDSKNMLNANNVIINASGKIINSTNIDFRMNLTGNLTIDPGGIINLTGDYCIASNGACSKGGNLTISAQFVNASGKVLSDGGAVLGGGSNPANAGDGGITIINASTLFVSDGGTISAGSDDVRVSTTQGFNGGKGGSIIINATLVNNTGTIKAVGGNAYSGSSGGGCAFDFGQTGNGGIINITAVTVSNTGLINVEKGPTGGCNTAKDNQAADGQIWINNRLSPCNNGSMLEPSGCRITKGINVPNDYVVNFSGYNLTLGSGARLNGNGFGCSSGVCTSGNDFTIVANVLNLSGGSISSVGGSTLEYNQLNYYAGNGGTITINASVILIEANSEIKANGGDHIDGTTLASNGGSAGDIIINASFINASGKIKAAGGQAETDSCTTQRGKRGNGGTIRISAANISLVHINASRGYAGGCNNGNGGSVYINATGELFVIDSITSIGNISGNITLSAHRLFVNSSLNASNYTSTNSGTNGTIRLFYNETINISTAAIDPAPFITKENEFGKIEFINRISGYASLDLNKSVNITNNLISVDGNTGNGALNQSANLTLKGLVFTSPGILRRGLACPATICTNLSYSSSTGILVFNVSQFTNYSAEEDVAPVVRLDSPANYTWSGASFTAAITPFGALLNNCTLHHNFTGTWQANVSIQSALVNATSVSFPAITVSDSLFVWDARCNNTFGSSAFNGSNFTARIDTAVPTEFSLTTPTNGTITSNLSPALTWGITTEANFANYTVQVSNGTNFNAINYSNYSFARTEGNASVTLAANYGWQWRVIAFDLAGNNFTSGYFNYTTDTINPAIRLESPSNNSFAGGSNKVTFTYTSFDANLKNCSLYHNYNSTTFNENQTNTTAASGIAGSFNMSVNESIDSSFIWNIRCYDNASNNAFNNTNFTVRVDTSSPQDFSLLNPQNNTFSKELTPIFNWSQTVEGNFVNYTLEISNGTRFETINYTAISTVITEPNATMTLADNSTWYWKVIAFDSAGNNATSGFFRYTADHIDPVITNMSINGVIFTTRVNITANCTDNAGNISYARVEHNGTSEFANSTMKHLNGDIFSYSALFPPGSFNITNIYCSDGAGNIARNSTSFTFTVTAQTITETVTKTETITSTSGGGGGSLVQVPKIVKVDILIPQPITLYLNDSLMLPIMVRNTGELDIQNLTLDILNLSSDIFKSLNQTGVEKLKINESVTTNVIFKVNVKEPGRIDATFTAEGKYPSITVTSKILIDIVDRFRENKTEVIERTKFLADLFRSNPECLEFNELLKQAEEASQKNEFQKATALTESAINACRELLSYQHKRIVTEVPKKIRFRLNIPLIIVLVLIILALLLYFAKNIRQAMPHFRLPKLKRGKSKKVGPTQSEVEEINKLLKGGKF